MTQVCHTCVTENVTNSPLLHIYSSQNLLFLHDDVIKWKHFPRYWPFVRGIPRSPVNSPHKGQWRGALMFTLIWARIIGWVNNREAGDLRRNRGHYDVIVMHKSQGTLIKGSQRTMIELFSTQTYIHALVNWVNIHHWFVGLLAIWHQAIV